MPYVGVPGMQSSVKLTLGEANRIFPETFRRDKFPAVLHETTCYKTFSWENFLEWHAETCRRTKFHVDFTQGDCLQRLAARLCSVSPVRLRARRLVGETVRFDLLLI